MHRARDVADQAKPPDTESFTVESLDIGEVVAHAKRAGDIGRVAAA
jgi:hypothetical protein